MIWFRLYSEARNDAKLRTLTSDEFRTWFNLLCLSSEQGERGVIAGYSEDLLAIETCNGDVTMLVVTLEKLEKLRIIERGEESEIIFVNFAERQARQSPSPSDAPEKVAARVRKHREKQKKELCNEDVTGVTNVTNCNEGVTTPVTDNRREENREEYINQQQRTREETELLDSVLGVLEKSTDWQMGSLSSKSRIAIENLVRKLVRDRRTVCDVEVFRERLPIFLGRDPTTFKPPTPAQMLDHFDAVLNFDPAQRTPKNRYEREHKSVANLREALIYN